MNPGLRINGQRGWLWRAVDDAGEVLDILVQRHRSARAATRFFRKLLKGLRMVPRTIVTDRLASYAAARAVVLPTVSHLRRWRQNNRVENSHQPVRQRERRFQRFKGLRHAARFCSVFSTLQPESRLKRPSIVLRAPSVGADNLTMPHGEPFQVDVVFRRKAR